MRRHFRFGFFGIKSISILLIVAASLLSLSFYSTPKVHALGNTYYVSPSGSDSNNGTSPQTAWQTVDKANNTTFGPGDSLLFEGGQNFSNPLVLDYTDLTSFANPITISSYGTGKANFNVDANNNGITLDSVANVVITDLNFVDIVGGKNGAFRAISNSSNTESSSMVVENSNFSGFSTTISVGSSFVTSIEINGNVMNGGELFINANNANVHVFDNEFLDSASLTILNSESGTVENNYFTGYISFITASNILFQFNEMVGPANQNLYIYSSHDLKIQYNYFHDVDSPIQLDADDSQSGNTENNIIRYNIFENYVTAIDIGDYIGRGYEQNFDTINSNLIYNNTFYTTVETQFSSTRTVFYSLGTGSDNNKMFNNIIYQTSGEFLNDNNHSYPSGFQFSGNLYYNPNTPTFQIGGQIYNSLSAFRTGTNNEKNGPVTNLGLDVDPGLANPGNGGTIGLGNPLTGLTGYLPASGSPVLGAGLDLTSSTYGSLNIGSRDFYGNTLSSPYSIGAAQASTVPSGGAQACTNQTYASGTNSGTSVTTITYLQVCAGVLSITAPANVILSDINVSSSETNTTGTTDPVIIQDLRGNNAGWSATATVTNFVGATDASKIIKLATQTSGGDSKFTLTPGALSLVNGDGGSITGLNDYTTAQTTTSLTGLDAGGTSNTFNLASFSTGNGAGKFQKTLGLSLDVPAYSLAQTYTATITSSVA